MAQQICEVTSGRLGRDFGLWSYLDGVGRDAVWLRIDGALTREPNHELGFSHFLTRDAAEPSLSPGMQVSLCSTMLHRSRRGF